MGSQPFFALLLMYLKFVAISDMKKMSTDGRCIYFSPTFLEKLYTDELDYILCHQILHVVLNHIGRPCDRKNDDYHFACDIQVNAILEKSGFEKERYPHLGHIHQKIPCKPYDVDEMSAEEIFDVLPYSLYVLDEKTRSSYLADSDFCWDSVGELPGEVILDLPDMESLAKNDKESGNASASGNADGCKSKKKPAFSGDGNGDGDTSSDNLRRQWNKHISLAANLAKQVNSNNPGIGCVPEFAERMIEKMDKPKLDWKKILNNFIQEQVCDYSFSPPDRRFADTGFFLPDFNEKDFAIKEVLFMADTSCSVGDKELAVVYSEIRGAIEQFGGKLEGKLGFFEVDVIPPIPFATVDDLMKIIPYGGGGTNFFAIFDYIATLSPGMLPSCIIIFTDGYGIYPEESESLGIPVLWIINNPDVTPPWGKVVHLLMPEDEGDEQMFF